MLFGIIAFSLTICNAFLQMHYSSDTYCLIYRGYFDYPSYYFLLDARLISALVCYLGGILHLPYDIYIIGSDIIGVILLSVSVFLLNRFMVKRLAISDRKKKVVLLIAIYVLIFNHTTVEYLLYPESAVMCLGILLITIASMIYITGNKYRYIKTLLLVLLATLCYQGIVNLLPVLIAMILFLKDRKKLTIKNMIPTYLLEMIKIGIIFIISMLFSYGFTQISDMILNDTSSRLRMGASLIDIITLSKEVICEQFSLMPKYLSIIVMVITSIGLLLYSKNKLLLIHYLLTVFSGYVFTLLPVLAWGYLMPRMAMGVGAIMGISCVFLVSLLEENKVRDGMIMTLIIVYFLFNTINFIRNANEHIAANKIDENMGATIYALLKDYEEKSGNTVTKFSYRYDFEPTQYTVGIKPLFSLTERKFMVPWCIVEATSFYCNKHFEKDLKMPEDIYDKYFNGKETNQFFENQIVFEGDIMYMYVYILIKVGHRGCPTLFWYISTFLIIIIYMIYSSFFPNKISQISFVEFFFANNLAFIFIFCINSGS